MIYDNFENWWSPSIRPIILVFYLFSTNLLFMTTHQNVFFVLLSFPTVRLLVVIFPPDLLSSTLPLIFTPYILRRKDTVRD
jgi:hypothetical protein